MKRKTFVNMKQIMLETECINLSFLLICFKRVSNSGVLIALERSYLISLGEDITGGATDRLGGVSAPVIKAPDHDVVGTGAPLDRLQFQRFSVSESPPLVHYVIRPLQELTDSRRQLCRSPLHITSARSWFQYLPSRAHHKT